MSWLELPFKYGHAPDLPRSDGAAFSISGAVPVFGGIATDYGFVAGSVMAEPPQGAAEVYTTVGQRKVFFGTETKIFEWNGEQASAPTDRTGVAYAAGTDTTWSFAQFGDNTLAVNPAAKVQRSTGATFSAAATAAPMGEIIVNVGYPSSPQLMVFNYDDGTHYPDGWYCSALSSDTDWVNDYATFSASGRLLEPVGRITAAIPFRDGVVAFKLNAMYYGEFAPDGVSVWQWRRISSSIGCVGKHAVCSAEDAVYFADRRGFYRFDGSYPQRLPGYVHEDWSGTVDFLSMGTNLSPSDSTGQYLGDHVFASLSDSRSTIRWAFTSDVDENLSAGYVYNILSGRWTAWAAESSAAAPLVFASYNRGASITGETRLRSTTVPITCTIFSPRIGDRGSNFMVRKVWPMWRNGQNADGQSLGPTNESWATDDEITLFAYPGPVGTQSAEVTGVANDSGNADGIVSDRFVVVNLSIECASAWEMAGIALDYNKSDKTA